MKEDLNHRKIAIVTGGSAGLGFAIAKKFVSHNITTVITGRNTQKLEEAKSCLGDLCVPWPCDVCDLEKLPSFVESIVSRYGAIDVLVNNAGINLKKPLVEVTDADFLRIIQTNVLGLFALSREAAKSMIGKKKGVIINISSMAAHYGIPKVIAYTASKAAVEGMTRAMAVELSPLGIRVNCIAPGFIKTNMSSAALDSDPERKQKVLSRTPMGELGLPEDIANAAYFLATEESRFLTGTIIPVDGGNSIGF
jgi:NAD(P)-dependent dehydrogenase (short-subunit alcohol dehydrogenase family)